MQMSCSAVVREVAGRSRLLVLVVAASRRHLALRAARFGEHGVCHVFFFLNWGW